jgi:5-formyltetrahydrofolate cyclo-ligase
MRALRATLAREHPGSAARAAAHLPAELLSARIVGGYHPQGAEMDPLPLLARFAASSLAMPAAVSSDEPLVYRAWAEGDPLAPDAMGIPAPLASAPLAAPDLVIVPLLAFDRRGGRIGQGGGHFDRTLQALRAAGQVFALGLAFAGQEIAAVPIEDHDQPLDAILTEKRYIKARKDF